MKKAFFSNRIYKDQLNQEDVLSIHHALQVFNHAKRYAFQTTIREQRFDQVKRDRSLHITIKTKFQLDDYYANSAVQESNALLSSKEELRTLYIQNKEQQIQSVKKKIKSTKQRLGVLKKIKQSFIKGNPKFNKTSREQQMGNFFVVQFKNETKLYYHGYSFEHEYLEPEIKKLQSRLGQLNFKLDRFQKQIHSLKYKITSVVFGSKKLFKAQFTVNKYKHNHVLWKQDFDHARSNQMVISGRKDASTGNFVFGYDTDTCTLTFKTVQGKVVTIEHVSFPYGQKQVDDVISIQRQLKNKKEYGKPVAWAVEDHGLYFIFKCIVEAESNPHTNYSRANGIIGVDCNVDHLAYSNVNAKGQNLHTGSIPFSIEGKTSGQSTKIIERVAITLVDIAVQEKKPLALEKLDTTKSKVSNAYGSKKANRKLSLFAYRKLILSIKNRADKMGVAVFIVNPAYTSQIAKMKYMKRFGTSIHECAAFVIARRAMGFREKLPPVLHSLVPEEIRGLHHWVHWKRCMKLLSVIRTHLFYQAELFDLAKFRSTNEIFPSQALLDVERKCLVKLRG